MKSLSLGVLAAFVAASASAAPFQNGSFEIGPANPCNTYNIPAGDTSITGWTVSVGNIDRESAPSCGWQPSNGSNSLDLVGAGAGGIGGIQQTFDTTPGVTYRVSFDLAGNYSGAPVIKPLAVTINGVTTNYTFDTTGASQYAMGWTTKTLTFVATGASSTINFVSDVSAAGGALNAGAVLDNVRIAPLQTGAVAAIPLDWAHLGAAGLILLAATALFARRRLHARR
jgi:choice-of-anchor C domain-containing protein